VVGWGWVPDVSTAGDTPTLSPLVAPDPQCSCGVRESWAMGGQRELGEVAQWCSWCARV
jgi:hypothetical protein